MLQVTDGWTTQDGEWYVSGKPFGILDEDVRKYGQYANELGGATHIYVRAPVGSVVAVRTSDGQNGTNYIASGSGWVNHPMFGSSAYSPVLNEHGPWVVEVNGVEVANGIGLPNGWHVSTFLVVEDVADVPVPTPGEKHLQVLVDGVVVADMWV